MVDASGRTVTIDFSRWHTVYPAYINSLLSTAGGRRLSKKRCVENPQPDEIALVCRSLGLDNLIEGRKRYARDPVLQFGRVRVRLRNPDGTSANPTVPTKKALLRVVAEKIPMLKGRAAAAAAAASSASSAGSGGGKKKGGSKKKQRKKKK